MRRRWRSSAVLAAALVVGLSLPALAATTDDGGPESPAPTATATPDATPGPEVGDPAVTPEPTPTPLPSESPEGDDRAPAPAPTPTPSPTPTPAAPAPGEQPAEPQAAAPGATGSISGRITAPAGIDLTKVEVVASQDAEGIPSWSADVASDGTYTVSGLPPARYRVHFLGWRAGLVDEYWNDVRLYDHASLVVVGSGPVTGIDATLVVGATLAGRIRESTDCDLGYVYILAFPLEGGGQVNPSVITRDGAWVVTGLPAGTYELQFEGRYAGLDRVIWNTTGRPYQRTEITVGLGQRISGLDVTLNGPAQGCVPVRPFVAQVYWDLLERDTDWNGMDTWSRALGWQGVPRSVVADAITSSDEYRTRLVNDAYRRYLNRYGDRGGLDTWLREMRRGADIEDIQAAFVASEEFWLRSGSTPAGWVENLYRSVLGRGAGSSEIQWWTQRLAAGASRLDVARGFLYSTEHLTTVVDGYYVDLLERHIDPTGRAQWVRLIQQGYRDEQIIAGILSSVEYAAKVKRLWPSGI